MGWENSYWDAIEELYWEPRLLGLNSISKRLRTEANELVCVPKDLLPKGGSLYTRPNRAIDNLNRMRRLEVPLNHLFDICFSIAPSFVLNDVFLAPSGLEELGPFERLGREIATRYPGFADNTATQQDGFFVSENTLLGIELKVDAATSADQLLKYAALMVAEEDHSGRRDQLLLTFITPADTGEECFKKCKLLPDGSIPEGYLASQSISKMGKLVRDTHASNYDALSFCLARLKVSHMCWSSLATSCDRLALEARNAGGYAEATDHLLSGMAQSIRANPNTKSA